MFWMEIEEIKELGFIGVGLDERGEGFWARTSGFAGEEVEDAIVDQDCAKKDKIWEEKAKIVEEARIGAWAERRVIPYKKWLLDFSFLNE